MDLFKPSVEIELMKAVVKPAYICGALTELFEDERVVAKRMYTKIADLCQEIMGVRGFVPHEHYDPVAHANFTPEDVDVAERRQVCCETSVLIVVATRPSWGGGIEVEMAFRSNVPIVILKPSHQKVSRLLLGNPGVKAVIQYCDMQDALLQLRKFLFENFNRDAA